MAQLVILTATPEHDVVTALSLLSHSVRQIPASPASLVNAPGSDIIMVDGRTDLVGTKSLCKILRATGIAAPLFLVLTEGGLAAVSGDWGVDDILLDSAGPAEVDARIRLALGHRERESASHTITTSGLTIDEDNYVAKVQGRSLDLTFREFELLRFLASHSSRVFTREQLLSEVWGYDYFGGTRTVDVHVRRLRAKLGDFESLIGTVRNVGYRFMAIEEEREDVSTT